MEIVLASASPRRRALLEMLGVRGFKIIPAETGEEAPDAGPADAVCHIALMKARKVSEECPAGALVIAADTLVYLDGEALGKPKSADEAGAMLRRLSGRDHTVYTGVALVKDGREMTFAESTGVFFRPMSDEEIAAYVKTGEPMDKAGAYGAQGRGAVFIERIDGDFFNVMGLPLCRLVTMLRRFGVDLINTEE
ncbi:septum formation protein [Sporobacter termitidis DSM 10068]|uniref:dTTP/UTP pyrophosphatase n=1 Tax=Sporobacter termitidis DSM 10068 TaxID=1123282 RepID=A0A1M5VN68_9FIRM|nr:Maf family protein [Sporobacter termitidis]SHH76650.1 septum formation protein [Sporobacter termitidis DSM 10068]